MIPFYSKRNQVYPLLWEGTAALEKSFPSIEDWDKEQTLYAALEGYLPVPKVLSNSLGKLVLEYIPKPTLLEVLEQQEFHGFDPTPWCALTEWLKTCHALCGQLPKEGNLRNFLWDADLKKIIGLDLEGYDTISLADCGGRIAVTLMEYSPKNTPVKRQAAAVLMHELSVSPENLLHVYKQLSIQRSSQTSPSFSGIILAGGASRRMGQSKADLLLSGKTLLQRQVSKMRTLGIHDILLSGVNCPHLPGTRVIPDEIPGRGPLSGLHACLQAAAHETCLVLSVDAPLIPLTALNHLCRSHRKDITVVSHGERQEPLIGLYDRRILPAVSSLLQQQSAPVRALQNLVTWNVWEYLGPEALLCNCNTPQDLARVESLIKRYSDAGIPV